MLSHRVLVNMTDHFLPRKLYRGAGIWTWSMQREGQWVKGKGCCILSIDKHSFTIAGLREIRNGTDHRIIMVVLLG